MLKYISRCINLWWCSGRSLKQVNKQQPWERKTSENTEIWLVSTLLGLITQGAHGVAGDIHQLKVFICPVNKTLFHQQQKTVRLAPFNRQPKNDHNTQQSRANQWKTWEDTVSGYWILKSYLVSFSKPFCDSCLLNVTDIWGLHNKVE